MSDASHGMPSSTQEPIDELKILLDLYAEGCNDIECAAEQHETCKANVIEQLIAREAAIRADQLKRYMRQRCGCLNCDQIADDLEQLQGYGPQSTKPWPNSKDTRSVR